MSRDIFTMRLSLLANGEVLVTHHSIAAITRVDKTDKKAEHTIVLLNNGVAYEVKETPDAILQRGQSFGILKELK